MCPHLSTDADSDTDSITAESDIYEDPATTNEGVIPNPDPLDMRNYLVAILCFVSFLILQLYINYCKL